MKTGKLKIMKTIKKGNEIIRVEDTQAENMVRIGGWEYCGKEEWKKICKTKTTKNQTSDLEVEEISDNLSDKKKRKLRKENKRKKYESK
jgi:hypothetical protein